MKTFAIAVLKRAACDFGLWLCHFDQGKPGAEKDREGFLALKAKHEAAIRAWKKAREH